MRWNIPDVGTLEDGRFFSVIGDAVHWCCHMLGSCIYGCWKAAVWCVKLCWRMGIWCVKNGWKVVVWAAKACWNLFWGCTGIVSGMFACMCLFGMGLLLVLLVQGYPLVGITIGMLGLTLCAGSVTIWCFTLPIRRKKEEAVGSGEETAQTEEELTGEGEAVHA